MVTHESFIAAVSKLAIARLPQEERAAFDDIKLVYGAGQAGLRGVTYYQRWKKGETQAAPFVEVCAFGQESWVQLAGTTIHELGHVLAGHAAGHDKMWKAACGRLGIRRILAAGTEYRLANFEPDMRLAIAALPRPDEGEPIASLGLALGRFKACPTGIGTRGGKSRGKGSGSRLRLWECSCEPAVKVRVARDNFDATCNACNALFCQAV